VGGTFSTARNNRNWRWLRHTVDPERLPCTIDLMPPRWAIRLIAAAGLVCLIPVLVLLWDLDLSATPFLLVALLFLLLGLVMLGFGLPALFEQRQVTFGRDGVRVVGRSLTGRENWSLPYAAYPGVLRREHVVERKHGSTSYQIIELHHDDLDRILPLSVQPGDETPRALWERYARVFDLPALVEEGGRLVGREAADLDKPISVLASEAKITHAFDPAADPPDGLLVTRESDPGGEEGLRVTVTASRMPLTHLLIFVGFGIAGTAISAAQGSYLLAPLATAFIIAIVWARFAEVRRPRQLLITREAVALVDAWQPTGTEGQRLKCDEIENVAVRYNSRARGWLMFPGNTLVIEADRGSLILGSGLSRPALHWLRDYLVAAIATA
jgi:hypothetical protein